nr:hypothetical protein [Tanacetum cinerariifolium]
MKSMFEEYRQREQAAKLSTHTSEPSRRFNPICYDDYDYNESIIPLNEINSQIPTSIVITTSPPVLPIEDHENIESNDSYDSNLDELDLLVTPLSDANKNECFDSGDDDDEINVLDCEDSYYDSEGDILYLESLLNDDLVHHDPSIPAMSVASILEGFTDEPPIEENDDLFDLESNNDDWKMILIASDLEVSRARGFVHRPLELQSFAYGNPIS